MEFQRIVNLLDITSGDKDLLRLTINDTPFINCISKINGVQINNAEDLDVVMLMYNLLEYSKNYRKTTSSLQNYCRDKPNNPPFSNSESFKYKTSITGNTYNIVACDAGYVDKVGRNETEIGVPLKHLSNFCRTLTIPLINCETELTLTWFKNLADMAPANNPPTGLEV